MLQDFLADAQVFGIVGGTDPNAQDIRAVLVDHLLRRGHIAVRLRHFPPFLIQHEAMGEDSVIRRAATCAAAFQQGRVEPAAMLIRAF